MGDPMNFRRGNEKLDELLAMPGMAERVRSIKRGSVMDCRHIESAIDSAARGSRVCIYAKTATFASEIFHEVKEALDGSEVRLSNVNGDQYVRYANDGKLSVLSGSTSQRGRSFDRLYIPIGVNEEALVSLLPTLAASDDGLITGY